MLYFYILNGSFSLLNFRNKSPTIVFLNKLKFYSQNPPKKFPKFNSNFLNKFPTNAILYSTKLLDLIH